MEHKYEIIFLTFLETGSRFVSVDKKGYIFLWEYSKFYYNSSLGGFKPNSKNRICMDLATFKESSANSKKILPLQNTVSQQENDKEGKRYYQQIVKNKEADLKMIFERVDANK